MDSPFDFTSALLFLLVVTGVPVMIGIAAGYPVSMWLSQRLTEILSFLPRERFDVAPPALGVASAKAVRGDFAGAVEAYEAMLLSHPHHKEIYIRLMEIHFDPLHQPERGEEVLQQALRQLPDEMDRQALLNLAVALRNGTHRPYGYLDPSSQVRPPAPTPPPLAHP